MTDPPTEKSLALGASPSGILRIITRQQALLGFLGLVVGVPGVIVVIRLIGRVLAYATRVGNGTIFAVAGVPRGFTGLIEEDLVEMAATCRREHPPPGRHHPEDRALGRLCNR